MKSKNPFLYKITLSNEVWNSWDSENNGIVWCMDRWSAGGFQKESHWYYIAPEDEHGTVTFCFRDSKDYTMFMLRWG